MNLEYIISKRTNGANPFKILNVINTLNPETLKFHLKRMPYHVFLETAYWFAVSSKAKSLAGMRCQVCNSADAIAVHHRTYDTHGEEHANMNDLVILCQSCHGLFHGHSQAVPQFRKAKLRVNQGTIIPHSEEDIEIPEGESFVLTFEMINSCRANGAFTNATMRAFGITKSTMTKGWVSGLIGKTLTREEYQKARAGRFQYNSGKLD